MDSARHPSSFDKLTMNSGRTRKAQDALLSAVQEIDADADDKPDDKSYPVLRGEREHEHEADQHTGERHERHQRDLERPWHLGMRPSHDKDRGADYSTASSHDRSDRQHERHARHCRIDIHCPARVHSRAHSFHTHSFTGKFTTCLFACHAGTAVKIGR